MAVAKITREDLRSYLEGERSKITENLQNWRYDRGKDIRILNEAIDGLRALDGGEVPPIFLKTNKKSWGDWPVQALVLELKALQHIAKLREIGYSASKAYTRVAKRYQVEVDQIKQWRRRLIKLGEIDGLTVVEHEHDAVLIHRTAPKLAKQPLSPKVLLKHTFKQIKRDGEAFRLARKKKKSPT